jgi:hypothetical protein
MAKLDVLKDKTDVTVYVQILDASKGGGEGLTGLVYNSSGLVCYYVRPLGSATALTLATQTVTGAHSDGGFVEVSSSNMPGLYRLDLSDAICATGVDSVVVMLKGATNMAPVLLEIELTGYNPYAALSTVTTSQVNAEVVDALNVDTYAEPGQGTPGATITLAAKINYLYKAWRNRITQTATTYSLYNDDASTVDHKATVSDNGTTYDKGEVATGP